ncbi:hypothetical protein J7L48_00890 [bacterium]|nr:hypothetical protein [bacterium]
MKRNFFKYFTLLLVLGLMIFAGCSKSNTDLQTIPETQGYYTSSMTNSLDQIDYVDYIRDQLYLIDGKYYYIPKVVTDSVPVSEIDLEKFILVGDSQEADNALSKNKFTTQEPSNMLLNDECSSANVDSGYTHFLVLLKYFTDEQMITFKKENMRHAFSNKLSALIKMINSWNLEAVYQKGIHDVGKHIEEWIDDDETKEIALNFLGITQWMIENQLPYIPEDITLGFFKCLNKCFSAHGTALSLGCALAVAGGMLVGPGGAAVGGTVCLAGTLALAATCSVGCVK